MLLHVGFIAKSHEAKYNDVENQHIHPAAWSVAHWLPSYASAVINRYLAVLITAPVPEIMDTQS
jgi:hypothetical protein